MLPLHIQTYSGYLYRGRKESGAFPSLVLDCWNRHGNEHCRVISLKCILIPELGVSLTDIWLVVSMSLSANMSINRFILPSLVRSKVNSLCRSIKRNWIPLSFFCQSAPIYAFQRHYDDLISSTTSWVSDANDLLTIWIFTSMHWQLKIMSASIPATGSPHRIRLNRISKSARFESVPSGLYQEWEVGEFIGSRSNLRRFLLMPSVDNFAIASMSSRCGLGRIYL